MATSDVGRIVIREYCNYSSTGNKERDVVAPPGYRVVSGSAAFAEDEQGNYGDADMLASYPKTDVFDELHSDTWRFQFKLNATTAFWLHVVCERSDEPDVFITRIITGL